MRGNWRHHDARFNGDLKDSVTPSIVEAFLDVSCHSIGHGEDVDAGILTVLSEGTTRKAAFLCLRMRRGYVRTAELHSIQHSRPRSHNVQPHRKNEHSSQVTAMLFYGIH